MSTVRAVVVTPGASGSLAIGEVAKMQPLPSEALVRVQAISLNLGEVRRAQGEAKGLTTGWDFAGTVIRGALSGKWPREGARVVGIVERGAWAEEVVVPSSQLAELPDAVSFAQAATLPVAGLTALYALEQRGGLLGRRVLVTGASGGVGHFACQLAAASGAHVVALVRIARSAALASEARADVVVAGEDASAAAPHGPYDIVVDGVGGAVLGQALSLLAKDGICALLMASRREAPSRSMPGRFFDRAGPRFTGSTYSKSSISGRPGTVSRGLRA